MKDRSPWLELHVSAAHHRKTYRLAAELNIDRAAALGYITTLWLWALEHAQDGDLSALSAKSIAQTAGYSRRAPSNFVQALIAANFMDADYHLHEWKLYVSKLMERRATDRERKRIQKPSEHIPMEYPAEPRTSQSTVNSQQPTPLLTTTSAGARVREATPTDEPGVGATAAAWLTYVQDGRAPNGAAFLAQLEGIDFAHGAACTAWAFGQALGKAEPWAYARRVLASCEAEGHGPRGGSNGRRANATGTDEGRRHRSGGRAAGGAVTGEPRRGDQSARDAWD